MSGKTLQKTNTQYIRLQEHHTSNLQKYKNNIKRM